MGYEFVCVCQRSIQETGSTVKKMTICVVSWTSLVKLLNCYFPPPPSRIWSPLFEMQHLLCTSFIVAGSLQTTPLAKVYEAPLLLRFPFALLIPAFLICQCPMLTMCLLEWWKPFADPCNDECRVTIMPPFCCAFFLHAHHYRSRCW